MFFDPPSSPASAAETRSCTRGAAHGTRVDTRLHLQKVTLFGCPEALCLLQTRKLGQEVLHFSEDYVLWQFKNAEDHLSISVTD